MKVSNSSFDTFGNERVKQVLSLDRADKRHYQLWSLAIHLHIGKELP